MGLVFLEFGKQRDQFRIFMQTLVENHLLTIENFNKQFQIGEKEREAVKWGWESRKWGRPCSLWPMRTPEQPSLKDYRQRIVIGCRRLGEWCWDG
jgi:hypothetical protein